MSIPRPTNPVYAKDWFLENHLNNTEDILSYTQHIVNGTFPTDCFLPTPVSHIVTNVHDMCLGNYNPVPRPQHVASPFGEFDVRPFDARIVNLE